MEFENANAHMQENDDEYDDNELPAVASGLVNSVLKNVNNQIISGTIDMDISNNDNVCMDTSNPKASPGNSPNKSQVNGIDGVNQNESVASMSSNVIPTNYSQDSFDVSVKDPGVPSVAEMDDKTQELDLQRNRSATPLLENAVSEDVVTALVSDIALGSSEPVVTKDVIQEVARKSPETTNYQKNHLDLDGVARPAGRRTSFYVEDTCDDEEEEKEVFITQPKEPSAEKTAEVTTLENEVKRLEEKVKKLAEEMDSKDASLVESERLRHYLEKDLNNMCIRMKSDKEHDMMNSKAKYAQWTAHAAAEKSEYEKKKPKAQPTPHPDRSKSSKLCVVL